MLRSKEIRPDAVAIYIRWSTEEQGEGTTLDVQKERCSLFVLSQGWMVRERLIFVDDGYSAASLDRPAMTRLRAAVTAGEVDCVVTYKLDRLSRNLVDTITLVRHEWAGKCIYRSATEGFDTSQDSPTGGLIFNILASFAEFERAVIRDRTRSGSLRRMKEGMYISGTVPFGYERAGKGQLSIKPGEALTVQRIFQMVLDNVTVSATGIAKKLNTEGIPGPSGAKWWTSAVERLLGNPLYAGTLVYGKRNLPRSVPGGEGRHDVEGQALAVVEGAVPAIIDGETFEKVRAILLQRREAKPKGTNRASADYLLTTIATCKCGGPLGGVKDRYGNIYYRCQRRQQGWGCAAGSVAFRGAPVEERLVAELRARFGAGRREEALRVIRERASSSTRSLELHEAIKGVEQRKAAIHEDLARLRRQARQGELKPSTYEEFKADADSELMGLEERVRTLSRELASTEREAVVLERLEQTLVHVDEWEVLAPSERKELLRALCKELRILYKGRNGGEIEVDVTWVG